jgi:hypothetical protein
LGDRGGPGAADRRVLEHPATAQPTALAERVAYDKEEVFEICESLARAEALLARLGWRSEAARLARSFELAESRLAAINGPIDQEVDSFFASGA